MQEDFSYSQIPCALIACYQTGMDLPLRIREKRKSQKLTLADLAGKVGVSVPHMSEIERGKKNLNNHLLVRIAAALDVEPADLIQADMGQDLNALIVALGDLTDEDVKRVRSFVFALQASAGK